jgi:TetR/AcrR family transcriptional regulator, cholesterol catabolism regulator
VVNRAKPGRATRHSGDAPARQEDGRWNELLAISATSFAEHGYKSTTLQDIADQFGVLKGSLYHYIRSKDDLLFEIVRAVYTRGVDNLRELAAADTDPATRLRSVVRGHVLYLIDNLVETSVLLHEFEQLSEARREQIALHEYSAILADLIEDAQRAGVVRSGVDAQLAALAALGAMNWVYRWYRPDGRRSPAEIADQYAEIVIAGLLEP